MWKTATGQPLGPPLQHQGAVDAVAFSPDGKTVLTGSGDKTARLWEMATGKLLGPVRAWSIKTGRFPRPLQGPPRRPRFFGLRSSPARNWTNRTRFAYSMPP